MAPKCGYEWVLFGLHAFWKNWGLTIQRLDFWGLVWAARWREYAVMKHICWSSNFYQSAERSSTFVPLQVANLVLYARMDPERQIKSPISRLSFLFKWQSRFICTLWTWNARPSNLTKSQWRYRHILLSLVFFLKKNQIQSCVVSESSLLLTFPPHLLELRRRLRELPLSVVGGRVHIMRCRLCHHPIDSFNFRSRRRGQPHLNALPASLSTRWQHHSMAPPPLSATAALFCKASLRAFHAVIVAPILPYGHKRLKGSGTLANPIGLVVNVEENLSSLHYFRYTQPQGQAQAGENIYHKSC